MIALTSTGTELRRFRRGTLPRLALGALLLIPLLYGALYLWAFWDPTGRMDNLPVALVVEDVGATVDGEPLDAGAQIADRLTDSGDLLWQRTDAATAAAGVRDGDYYFAVTIPADFSATIAGAGGDDPTSATLAVTYNDANSFLATTLGRSAMEQVQTAVREQVGTEAVDKVLVGLGSARDGFATASDGALRLTTAAGQVDDGAQQLAEGATSASSGAHELASGLTRLRAGTADALDGATRLGAGTGSLADGAATLHSGAVDLSAGTATLADGAQDLAAGTSTLRSGARSLSDGVAQAHTGAQTLADGAGTLVSGAARLSSGAEALASGFTQPDGMVAGADQLAAGSAALAQGLDAAAPSLAALPTTLDTAGQLLAASTEALTRLDGDDPDVAALVAKNTAALERLSTIDGSALGTQVDEAVQGARQVAAGAERLSAGVTDASTGATTLAAQLRAGTTGTVRGGIDALAAGASSLEDGLATLTDGAGRLASGTKDIASGAARLRTGSERAAAGADSLATGAGSLSQGADTVADGTAALTAGAQGLLDGARSAETGAATLADGTASLAAGGDRLASGTAPLADGAGTLADRLVDGAAQLPDDSAALRTQRAEVIAAPVGVVDTDLAQAEGFGEGFAPFFLSLALFVGALITWLLLRPVPPRALAAPVSGIRIALAGYGPAFLIGIGQVVVMLTVVKLGLKLDTVNLAGVVAFTLLVSATFVALQQAIIAVAGPAAGKVVILAVLMLQLAASGGTYPVPVTAGFFQAVHPWMPMSYAVTGLRQLITGGADGRLVTAVLVLAGTLLVSLGVTAWRSGRMRTWTVDRLHPAIAL
ncbi:membrane protein [Flavimobilis marinus]|uniref:Putative membrane protein n=1 Tax=Flavimobilis marinus TaxID=285351 RepID=A0A1I2CKC6_9MICO|nr:YhgE/Pip domain-containing protein [Flavimobilis marinus]GHG47441.1 membrane protein [Flavimobilis marinus]SFE68859.1 putative membrane protein [Flavimobilis marinus]